MAAVSPRADPQVVPVADQQLRRLYLDERRPLTEIADRAGLSVAGVRSRLARLGIQRRQRPAPRLRDDSIDVEKARDLYVEEGMSLRAIADVLGTTPDKLQVRLTRAGVTLREPGRWGPRVTPLDRHWLVDAYLTRRLAIDEMAAEAGCSAAHIRNELRRHGVHRRRAPTAREGWMELTPDVLHQLYVVEELTLREIAERAGGSDGRVLKALRRAGIARRPRGAGRGRDLKPLTPDVLHQLYVVESLSAAAIAERVGGSPERVRNALIRAGIARRRGTARRSGW